MKPLDISSLSSVRNTFYIILFLSIVLLAQKYPTLITSIEQINYIKPIEIENSASALITINYDSPPDQQRQVLNIVAKSVNPGFEDVWWGQNIILNPFYTPVTLNCVLDLHSVGGLSGMNLQELSIAYILTEKLLLEKPNLPLEEFSEYLIGDYNYAVGNGVETSTKIDSIEVTPLIPMWTPERDTTWIYRGCEVPNIDLDNSTYPFNMDNQGNILYQGDLNACAQASLANSFAWLDSKHSEFNTGLSTRQMIQQLDDAVNRDFASGAPDMQGVIEGALDFIDSNRIPISVKFQSLGLNRDIDSPNFDYGHSAENEGINPQNPNANQVSWDWIKSEMDAGEDVTMVYSNWDGTGWRSSHAVTLTGISKDANNMKLTFKDDTDQLNPGGASETQIDVRLVNGWLVTNQLSGGPGNQIITAVVSKSFDPTISFPTGGLLENQQFKFVLGQNYPNPFNPVTHIPFSISNTDFVILKVYNILGQEVAELVNKIFESGAHEVEFYSNKIGTGVYFYKISVGELTKTKKMILRK